jgi:hypothetical protein
MSQDIFIDVGTGSARSGLFDRNGCLLATAKPAIALWHDGADRIEQSSDEIRVAVCASVREATTKARVRPDRIAGIGFDATCFLVVLGDGAWRAYPTQQAAMAGIMGEADTPIPASGRIAAMHQHRFDAFQALSRVAHPLAGIRTRET